MQLFFSRFEMLLQNHKAILLPLRFFIALGWLRACAEKLSSSGWTSGEVLYSFLVRAQGNTPFRFYGDLIEQVFLSNIEILSLLVAAGQGAIGLALLLGVMSQAALLLGIFLNLNFIFAGVINPSVFYIMIEFVLLTSHVGALFGFDAYFSRSIKLPWLIAQSQPSRDVRLLRFQFLRCWFLMLVVIALSVINLFYIEVFSPEASIEDPAMLLDVLAVFLLGHLFISMVQIRSRLSKLHIENNTLFKSSYSGSLGSHQNVV